jgi:hypothetical protein
MALLGLFRAFSMTNNIKGWGCPALARAGLSGCAPSPCGSRPVGFHPSPKGGTRAAPAACTSAHRQARRKRPAQPQQHPPMAVFRTGMRPGFAGRRIRACGPARAAASAGRAGRFDGHSTSCSDLPCMEPPRLSALLRGGAEAPLQASRQPQ